MKKIIIILTLIFGLTKLNSAQAPLSLAEKASLSAFYDNLFKAAFVTSAAVAAHYIYGYTFPLPEGIHSPHIGTNITVSLLRLDLVIKKNGWLNPINITINGNTDAAVYARFQQQLNRNLNQHEKQITGEQTSGNKALLQNNKSYSFTISGTVSYQGTKEYALRDETIIETPDLSVLNLENWIQKFWEKNIATRIASVWAEFPDFINDKTTTYCAVISETDKKLSSVSALHLENFKEQVIQAIADEIFADTKKNLTIKFSATMGKDIFTLAPITFAIDSLHANENILTGLQSFKLRPTFRAAQISYATDLWNNCCEPKFTRIQRLQPLSFKQKLAPYSIFLGASYLGGLCLTKLEENNLLYPAVSTFLGITALTKIHTFWTWKE
jgi:hypothetical protein